MFGFFKKKEKKQAVKESETVLSEERIAELKQIVSRKKEELTNTTGDTEQAKLYEALGLSYAELQDESAIPALEKSLELKLSMGDGYKKLMSLYNAKRAEAARNGDDEGIEKYMNKMDEMRKIAKQLTISRGK